jgi:hypothetical protein
MNPVAGFLRKLGVRLVLYLDDMLLNGTTPKERHLFTQMAMNLIESLGFIINKERSVLTPTRTIIFLGFTINSITMLFILPPEKVVCCKICSGQKVLLRIQAQLLGLLESYRQAVRKAPLHFPYLQALLIKGLNHSHHNYET